MFECLTALQVRALAGVPATILLLLMSEPTGGNQEWIERYTGYSDKPVKHGLELLVELGLVTRAGKRGSYVYRLATKERQLPLPIDQIEAGDEPEIIDAAASDAPAPANELPEPEETAPEKIESEKFRLAPLASSSRSLNLDSRKDLLPPESRKAVEPENLRLAALLDRHQVRDPARSRLLSGGYDPETVEAHLWLSDSVGQAIYRIEHNWPVEWYKWRDWQQYHCRECGGTLYDGYHCANCDFDDDEGADDGEEDG
jgi:hypothetical protein